MPTIKIKLGTASIDSALKQLNQYRESLSDKTLELQHTVRDELKEMVSTGFNGDIYDDVIAIINGPGSFVLGGRMRVPDVDVTAQDSEGTSYVIAYGEEAVFAEFGAGVYYNGPVGSFPHPNPPSGLKAIGTYGYGLGARDMWEYTGSDGKRRLTHGTPASMPMYHATQEMKNMIPGIARTIFRSDES